jgi:tetratricopeptide (TPR) repeat protein
MCFNFLFYSIFGWWILFLVGASLFSFAVHRFRLWDRRRRRLRIAEDQSRANPGNAEVRFELALINAENGNWVNAEALVREAIDTVSTSQLYNHVPHKFLRLKADCLRGRDDPAAAAEAYRKALEVKSDGGYDKALLGVCRSEWRADRPEAALEFARHALDASPSMLEAYFRWAQAADAVGKPEEVAKAREGFRRAASVLVRGSRHGVFRWRLAFLFFPLARRMA